MCVSDSTVGTLASVVGFDVSRETVAELEGFAELVQKWTSSVNLVSRASVSLLWHRHILDSLQLVPLLHGHDGLWIDLGSGGGLPAIPCAIVLRSEGELGESRLVEADKRKAVFLRTAIRDLQLPSTVIDQRIETLAPQEAHTITSRALSPLQDLLEMAKRHLTDDGRLIAMKGARWKEEVAVARKRWQFDLEALPSITDPQARILVCKEIHSV